MQDTSKERIRRLLPYFDGDLFIAVFNCSGEDEQKAHERIKKEFGEAVWRSQVLNNMKTGIMEIFHVFNPPRALRRFAWYVGMSSDHRRSHQSGP